MPVEILHRQDSQNPLSYGLVAYEDRLSVGYLNYTLEDEGVVSLDDVTVFTPRQGIGRALLQEFVRLIGSGRFITGVVIHKDTLAHLESLGLLKVTGEQVNITDREFLSAIPIVRFLRSGGISTTRLAISYVENPKHGFVDQIHVELNGITLDTNFSTHSANSG